MRVALLHAGWDNCHSHTTNNQLSRLSSLTFDPRLTACLSLSEVSARLSLHCQRAGVGTSIQPLSIRRPLPLYLASCRIARLVDLLSSFFVPPLHHAHTAAGTIGQ